MLFAIGIGLLALVVTAFTSTALPVIGPILVGIVFGLVIGKVADYFTLNIAVAIGICVGYVLTFRMFNSPFWVMGLYVTMLLYALSLLFGRVWRSVAKHPQ